MCISRIAREGPSRSPIRILAQRRAFSRPSFDKLSHCQNAHPGPFPRHQTIHTPNGNCQLSIVNCQLFRHRTVHMPNGNCQLSIVNCQLFRHRTVHAPNGNCQLSIVNCQLFRHRTVHTPNGNCQLSIVNCQLKRCRPFL